MDEPAPAPTPEVTKRSCQCTNPRTEAAELGQCARARARRLTCHEATAQQQPLGVSHKIHEVPWKDTQTKGQAGVVIYLATAPPSWIGGRHLQPA